MARLFILASLMSASLMTQAAMPTWMPNFDGYFSKTAATHTATSFADTAKQKAAELWQAAKDNQRAVFWTTGAIAVAAVVAGAIWSCNTSKNDEKTPVSSE